MPEALPDPYAVHQGDTLSSVAKRAGCSVADLQRWNKIADANRLQVGQTLYLSDQSAFGFSVLFLDALRAPIANLAYRLRFDTRTLNGTTGADGMTSRQVSKDANSTISVHVQDLDGQWRQIAQTASGYGHKLLTLISNAIVFKGETEPVTPDVRQSLHEPLSKPDTQRAGSQPTKPAATTGQPTRNDPALVRTRKTKGPKGQPVVKVEIEIPKELLDSFGVYTGGDITEEQWVDTADLIKCEPEVLKAISVVESSGRSAFWRLNHGEGAHIPALLFERHIFSRRTKGRFDNAHPDLSWPVPYRKKSKIGEEDKRMHDGQVDADDAYGDYSSAYLRLIRAYSLDATAALEAASWGKFQILGTNYSLCGRPTPVAFVDQMCMSEAAQIGLLANFIQKKPPVWIDAKDTKKGKHPSLLESVRKKDWAMIAFNYNGPGYKTYSYDIKLRAAYEKYRSESKG